mgnify:CR=1 FL=1
MDKFIIEGGGKLYGRAEIQSAKNSVLPLLAASVLTDEQVTIRDVPAISDVENMLHILSELGCEIRRTTDSVIIDSANAVSHEIPARLTKELRSSVFMLGSVLTRFHRAKISYPGGCDIGLRPIDLHLSGLKRLDVKIEEDNGYILCSCDKLTGGYPFGFSECGCDGKHYSRRGQGRRNHGHTKCGQGTGNRGFAKFSK